MNKIVKNLTFIISSGDARDIRSQPESQTYQFILGSVELNRVYLSKKKNYKLWFYKPVVPVDLQ